MKNRFYIRKFFVSLAWLVLTTVSVFAQPQNAAPRQEKLLNGLKILMRSDAQAPNVSVKIRVHSGAAFDPQGKEGAMRMLAENIFPNDAVREFFAEDLGGSLEIVTNYDYIQINATARPEEFLRLIETLANAVARPTIDKETTLRLRALQIEKVREMEKNPAYVADRAVTERLFGAFPYGRPVYGTVESLQKIDFADLIFARDRFFTADNATVAVTGNFKPDLAFRAARRYLGAWAKSDGRIASTFRQPDAPKPDLPVIASPAPNKSEFRIALRGFARNDDDFYAAQILERILQNRVQAREGKNAFVRHEAHVLPGAVIFGVSDWNLGRIKKEGNMISLPKTDGYQEYFLKEPIKTEEFEKAKSELAAQTKQPEAADLWLDADTFRFAMPKTAPFAAITDVQRVLEKLQKQPAATVLVFAEEATRTAN
ncbi:MAG TPA: pitrilysin family protein [Pyrinomonadaceae bacterium]|jgi:hypothetical protein